MRVRRLTIRNSRGVSVGTVDFPQHTLLVGGGNVGKSTVCEALELVLGRERLEVGVPLSRNTIFMSAGTSRRTGSPLRSSLLQY
jgi:predicted ATP-dependent endonuclease of OLD family